LINTAAQHLRAGRAAEALAYAERSAAIEPLNIEGRLLQAGALLALRRPQEAIRALQQLDQRGLAVPEVQRLLGEARAAAATEGGT
jgi:predicted Zn-dependent protease